MLDKIEELVGGSIRRLDIFKTILGLIFLIISGYMWLNYFLNFKFQIPIIKITEKGAGITIAFILTILSFVIGLWFFIVGISQMENIYSIEKTIIQINYLESLQKLSNFKIEKFSLNKTTIEKFDSYIKKKIKEAIKYFE